MVAVYPIANAMPVMVKRIAATYRSDKTTKFDGQLPNCCHLKQILTYRFDGCATAHARHGPATEACTLNMPSPQLAGRSLR